MQQPAAKAKTAHCFSLRAVSDAFYPSTLTQTCPAVRARMQGGKDSSRGVPAASLGLIIELLSFCVQHHSFRIKYYTLRNQMIDKVGVGVGWGWGRGQPGDRRGVCVSEVEGAIRWRARRVHIWGRGGQPDD